MSERVENKAWSGLVLYILETIQVGDHHGFRESDQVLTYKPAVQSLVSKYTKGVRNGGRLQGWVFVTSK